MNKKLITWVLWSQRQLCPDTSCPEIRVCSYAGSPQRCHLCRTYTERDHPRALRWWHCLHDRHRPVGCCPQTPEGEWSVCWWSRLLTSGLASAWARHSQVLCKFFHLSYKTESLMRKTFGAKVGWIIRILYPEPYLPRIHLENPDVRHCWNHGKSWTERVQRLILLFFKKNFDWSGVSEKSISKILFRDYNWW